LVIRSDLDARSFCISLIDVVGVLDGETVPTLLLVNRTQVGVAKRSASGKAMNIWIEPFLYTSPLARVMDVLEGRARKAAVWMGGGSVVKFLVQCRLILFSHDDCFVSWDSWMDIEKQFNLPRMRKD